MQLCPMFLFIVYLKVHKVGNIHKEYAIVTVAQDLTCFNFKFRIAGCKHSHMLAFFMYIG